MELHLATLKECWLCSEILQALSHSDRQPHDSPRKLPLGAERRELVEDIQAGMSPLGATSKILPSSLTIHCTIAHVQSWDLWDLRRIGRFDSHVTATSQGRSLDVVILKKPGGDLEEGMKSSFLLLPKQYVDQFTVQDSLAQRADPKWPLNIAKGWLTECIATHYKCSQNMSRWLPTRLLEIEKPYNRTVRLVHTKKDKIALHTPYCTLSHCWGTLQFLRLTADNQAQLEAGIAVKILPQTFHDAIAMTNFLGLRYIWIDSLCILQNSVDDWRRESSVMGRVYQNSQCNIAATSSANGNGGLNLERSPSLTMPCFVESSWDDDRNDIWHLCPRRLEDYRGHKLLEGPLLERGWVIQERVLARRTLHFGSRQLYWECRHHQACETYPRSLPLHITKLKGGITEFETLNHALENFEQNLWIGSRATMQFWDQIVMAFSRCNLTREEDKLVALSGIATLIQKRFPSFHYLAGIWEPCLKNSLLWEVKDEKQFSGEPSKRPTRYRAPSWSWAAVDGMVRMNSDDEPRTKAPFEILDVTVELVGSDTTGQVKGAALKVLGHIMTVGVRDNKRPWKRDGDEKELLINGWWQKSNWIRDVGEPCQKLHCLPIRRRRRGTGLAFLLCLLLQPTLARKGQFRRNEEWLEYEERRNNNTGYVITITWGLLRVVTALWYFEARVVVKVEWWGCLANANLA
ncbi:hypothetical protein G7Y89_g7936 [Cudoniella acicularis]|uniref:Heterokaryon incompatibility domain-containing protein n=1 Tax=Cudoniella acicularis TaxID=354080 RepID=A0A8H4RL41_9HELO|nr:hypothetical protein G7Y89_g7936 [Cudoniella acicularis]